jgi:exodeoxyribonuclease VII small subunit
MNNKLEELSYEQAFSELEYIIQELESGAKTLEESLAFFERGQALLKHCSTLLDQAELKIQQLTTEDTLVDID